MFNPEVFGYISGLMGSLSILPQIHKSYISGSSKDLSTKMFIIQYIAYALAIVYGILIKHVAVYLMNAIGFLLFIILHGIKIYNERNKQDYTTLNEIDSFDKNCTINKVSELSLDDNISEEAYELPLQRNLQNIELTEIT